MKKLVLILFLCFSLLATGTTIYAASDTLNANYPPTKGTYKELDLEKYQSAGGITCDGTGATEGLLYMNTTNKNLEICVNGTATAVPYKETCFNLFCSCPGQSCALCTSTANFTNGTNPCPTGYTQAKITVGAVQPLQDQFTSSTGYTIYSTACCNSNSSVLPTS